MSQPQLTETDIRNLASSQSYDRGYHYYHSGAVFDVIRQGNMLTAKVAGSEYEPYRIQVTLTYGSVAETSCTCPFDWGGICKHIAAALLVWIHERDEIEEKPPLEALLAELVVLVDTWDNSFCLRQPIFVGYLSSQATNRQNSPIDDALFQPFDRISPVISASRQGNPLS